MSAKSFNCSAEPSARILASAASARPRPRSSPPRKRRTRTISLWAFPPATIRPSANKACSFPAGNASASPSPAPSSKTHRSSCSTRRPQRSIRNRSATYRRRLRNCARGTTLVIAHRLSTITHADNILVVEAGLVVESGRHDELLRKGGRYASFYRLQLREQSPALESVAVG